MTVTVTPKLGLQKPDNDELTNPTLLNANLDKLDNTPGLTPVTSGTRPSSPYLGQRIIEQDKRRVLRWSGSQWVPVWPKPACNAGPTTTPIDYPTAGVWQKLPLPRAEVWDPWEMIDSANNRINLPWSGIYQFNAMWHTAGGINSGFLISVSIFKNDVFWAQHSTCLHTTSIGQTPGPIDFISPGLIAGDSVDYRAYYDVNTWDIHAGDTGHNRIYVHYLGG